MQITFKKPIQVGNYLGVSKFELLVIDDFHFQITYLGVHKISIDDSDYFEICRYISQQKGTLNILDSQRRIQSFEVDLGEILNYNSIMDLCDYNAFVLFLSENLAFKDIKQPQEILISHFENDNLKIELNEISDIYHISNYYI